MGIVARTSQLRPSRRTLVGAGVVAVAGTLLVIGLASLVLPGLVRRAAVERLQARVTAPVRIERVGLNVLTGRARAFNVVIGGDDGGQPIVSLPMLDVGLSYRALLRGAVRVRYLTFHQPRIFIERTGPESVNLVQMMRQPEGGGGPAAVTLDTVRIYGGAVTFVDRTQTPAFERTFTAIELATGRLSTLPALRFTPASFELRVGIGQGALVVTGATAPFGRPSGVELVARMERLDPGILRGYLPLRARVDLRGSRVDGEIRYVVTYHGNQATTNVLTAHVETGPIRFLPPDGETPIVSAAGLASRDISMDFLANRMRLGEVVVREPRLALERDPRGALNLTRLLDATVEPGPARAAASPPPATPGVTRQAAPPAEPARPFVVLLGQARVEGGVVEFTDRTLTPVATTALRGIQLRLRDVGLGPGAKPGQVEGEARLDRGTIQISGTLDGQTLAGRLRLAARGVPVDPFRPYLDAAFPNATARSGLADARLDLDATRREDGTLGVDLAGSVEGQDLALALRGASEPAVRARRLTVRFTRLALAPTVAADVDRVQLTGAMLAVSRERDGSLSLARLWGPPAAPGDGVSSPRSPPSPASRRVPVTVRRIEIADSRVHFTDATVRPAFRTTLSRLRADLRQAPGDVTRMPLRVEAVLEPSASVQFTGWVTPFATPLRMHLEANVREYELSALSPYAVLYASHPITRGRATTRTTLDYEDGSFTAENDIAIARIQIGEEVDSELRQGLGIPLELAVSLLEDSEGEIRLNLPVAGGPEGLRYQLGSVIRTALRNALVKTVAAPFRLFGSLVTVGGKIGQVRIDPVEFRPGSLEPNDEASERLAGVIEFLQSRPRIGLQLRGVATTNELEPLKRERLRARLKGPALTANRPLEAAYLEAGGPFSQTLPSSQEMERFILDHTELTEDDLHDLSGERARVIQEALIRRGVDRRRLFVVAGGDEAVADGGLGRVEFDLLY